MPDTDTVQSIRTKFEALRPLMTRAAPAALGRRRGGGPRPRRHHGRRRRHRDVPDHDHPRHPRTPAARGPPRPCADLPPGRSRRAGGGRKPLTQTDPTLLADLDALVEPSTRGDPQSPLALDLQEHPQAGRGVPRRRAIASASGPWPPCSTRQGYSLQANRKTREGGAHPDRDAQFEHINARRVRAFQRRGQPVISVDTKKKELVGDFKNGGREWQPAGQPEEVRVHDFHGQGAGQGDPLRRLRPDGQPGLGQRRHRPRHGAVRGRGDPPLVAGDGRGDAIPGRPSC